MITLEQALDALRLDEDVTTTHLIQHHLDAIPSLIEATTGIPATEVMESHDRLVETLALHLVQLLYNPDGNDSDRLGRVIGSLEKVLAARWIAEQEKRS